MHVVDARVMTLKDWRIVTTNKLSLICTAAYKIYKYIFKTNKVATDKVVKYWNPFASYSAEYRRITPYFLKSKNYCVSLLAYASVWKISLIRRYTLTYARGTLGIGYIRFKPGGIRWHTARQTLFFKHVQKFCAYRTYALYNKHTLGTRWIRQRYARCTVRWHFKGFLCVWKLFN
jgi:hypothetical protein